MSSERYETFVVRVLVRAESGEIVSGQVVHLASEGSVRFTRLAVVPTFIRDRLRPAAPVEPTGSADSTCN